MKRSAWLVTSMIACLSVAEAGASPWHDALARVNRDIAGKVIDYTHNHGQDNRIWSNSLGQKRDLYVYVPPDYNPELEYPIVILLHGFGQDERLMLTMAPRIDREIRDGKLPPVILAAPDGSITGEPSYTHPGSFFINSQAGDFESWVLRDVWNFVSENYRIRPEREAHVLAGVSMGGFAAFNLGIRFRHFFASVIGFHPPLNLRWVDCNGKYFKNFDPNNWGWRTKLDNPNETVARFYAGLVKIHIGQLVHPLFGFGDDALTMMARQNPIELIDATGLKNGDLGMFVGYGGKDEFNLDAQIESFLYLAKARGISVAVAYEPYGHHDTGTAFRQFPAMVEWIGPRLAPYAPLK